MWMRKYEDEGRESQFGIFPQKDFILNCLEIR